jgi:phage terminase large subunit GpA-like protein
MGAGEESWLIDRQIIMGRHDDEATLLRVDEAINKTYSRQNGVEMSISRICWDIGGIDPTIVYNRSKKHGLFRVIPVKGASVYGKPVANMPRKRNKNGVYLTEIGTDTAKEQIYNRLTLTPDTDGPWRSPLPEQSRHDLSEAQQIPRGDLEAQQLTAEEQVEKWVAEKSGTVKSGATRRSTALFMPLQRCVSVFPAGNSTWIHCLRACLKSRGQKPDKTLADYGRALSGEE